jgi:hypothetical protein
VCGQVVRQPIEWTNDYAPAGERHRTMPDWERDDPVLNLVTALSERHKQIQEKYSVAPRQYDAGLGSGWLRSAACRLPVAGR